MNILKSSIPEIFKLLVDKKISPVELFGFYLDRVKKCESNAYISIFEEYGSILSKKIEENGVKLSDPILSSTVVGIKDNFMMEGFKTTCASKMLADYISPYDATVVNLLKKNGAIILGKTNLDEFAMGSSNETSFFGPCLNSWDKTRVAGGSSGGSAVSVAKGLSHIAYGSDTGGSVRLPAAYNGVLGFKPTYGRISRYGIVSFASSLDQVGVFARNVEDLSIAYDSVVGLDTNDSTSYNTTTSVYHHLRDNVIGREKNINKYTIGIPENLYDDLSEDIKKNIEEFICVLKSLGFNLKTIKLPNLKYVLDTYYVLSAGEASSNLARYDGVRFGYKSKKHKKLDDIYLNTRAEGFGAEVKRRIMLGTFVLSSGNYDEYFGRAAKMRFLIKEDFKKAFKECDLILMPNALDEAFKLGEKLSDPLKMYKSDTYTAAANLAGIAAIAIPSGFSKNNLPFGVQFFSNHFEEEKLFELAWLYQKKRPDLFNNIAVERGL